MINATASLIGMITGIVGMILGIYALRVSQYNIIKEYYKDDDSDELKVARQNIFEKNGEVEANILKDDSYAVVCNHYHYYGLMAKKKYLPAVTLEGANAFAIIRSYECSMRYIELRRKKNPYYAENFEWLYVYLKRKGY